MRETPWRGGLVSRFIPWMRKTPWIRDAPWRGGLVSTPTPLCWIESITRVLGVTRSHQEPKIMSTRCHREPKIMITQCNREIILRDVNPE